MDKTERNLSNTLINMAPAPRLEESPSARFETGKYLAHAFFLPDRYHSPSLMVRDVLNMTVQMGLLSLDSAPAPRLEDFPSAPSRDKPKKTGKNLNSGGHVKCPDCNMGFHTYIAMFSHVQIHQDKDCKGFKNPSPKLNGGWTVAKNQSPREVPDRKIPEEVMASILIDLYNSTWNCQSKKSRIAESAPSEEEEEVAAILIDMPNLIGNCERRKRRMP